MLRYLLYLVLFTTGLICVRQMLEHSSADREAAASRAAARQLPPPISVAEAWRRYHDEVRRGIPCDGDLPPHPGVVAAILLVVSLRTLTRPLRTASAA